MRDSAVWRLLQKTVPKNRTPIWKIRAKIRTKNSATKLCTTKSASNLQPKSSVNLQDNTCRAPQRVSKRSRGVVPEVSLLVAPKSVTQKNTKNQTKNPLRDSGSFWNPIKMVLAAEFPVIPSSATKIASERRCAILVHSDPKPPSVCLGHARSHHQSCMADSLLQHILPWTWSLKHSTASQR